MPVARSWLGYTFIHCGMAISAMTASARAIAESLPSSILTAFILSLSEPLAHGFAGRKRAVVGCLIADEGDAGIAAVVFPDAHPVAVAPAVGTEECDLLAAEAALYGRNIGSNSLSSSISEHIAGQPNAIASYLPTEAAST